MPVSCVAAQRRLYGAATHRERFGKSWTRRLE